MIFSFDHLAPGADIMIPMAIPAFGGMMAAAITYFVVPVLYSLREERAMEKTTTEENKLETPHGADNRLVHHGDITDAYAYLRFGDDDQFMLRLGKQLGHIHGIDVVDGKTDKGVLTPGDHLLT